MGERSNLGSRSAVGVLGGIVAPNVNRLVSGAWLVRFPTQVLPADMDFEVYHATILGPGGKFAVYIDDQQYSTCLNGRLANGFSQSAMYVKKGQEISFNWTISTPPAPKVWIWLRQPEVGRV